MNGPQFQPPPIFLPSLQTALLNQLNLKFDMDGVQSMNFMGPRHPDPYNNFPITASFMGRNKYAFTPSVSLGTWVAPMTSVNPMGIVGSPIHKYVDPRNVDDCAFHIKDEPSPFSPPLSNLGDPSSSISSIGNESLFSDDTVRTRELSNTYPQFIYRLQTNTAGVPNSYANPFQEVGAPTESENLVPSPVELPTQQSPPAGEQLTPPPSPPHRRRGPGRPSKVNPASSLPPKRPTGHNAVKLRRQMHNDSAMRSRARLNQALEDLWKLVPEEERVSQPEIGEDQREVCRAVKVEVAISYLRKLKVQLASEEAAKFR